MWGTHKVGGSEEGGAAIALNAGIDQEGGGNSAINTLAQGIADGKTTKDEVARALRNLFRLRIRLGLLDPPMSVSYPQSPTAIITFVATSSSMVFFSLYHRLTASPLSPRPHEPPWPSHHIVLAVFRQVPYNDVRYNATELEFNEAHLAVARKAATEAMTLYKNEKDTLPLSDTKVKKLALIGPQGEIKSVGERVRALCGGGKKKQTAV